MSRTGLPGVADRLRLATLSDRAPGDLLRAFVANRDEVAFTQLVRQLAPMVWAICCRALRDPHAAEDAFQAAFLVLARRAAEVRPDEVSGWVYGVTVRVAKRAQQMAARRQRQESALADTPAASQSDPIETAELAAILDEEIAQLSDAYRVAVVLCEIEGASRTDAARRLGISEGTLSSRLAAARKKLADRLRKRGITLSVGAVAGVLADLGLAGAVPPPLVAAASAFGTTSPAVSAGVSTLAQGVIQTMFLHKLKLTAIGLAVVLLAGLGGSTLLRATSKTDDPAKPAAAARAGERPAANKNPAGPGRLLLWRNGELILIDPDGKNETKIREQDKRLHPSNGSLSPDGKRVVYVLPNVVPGEQVGKADPKLYIHTVGEKEPVALGVSGVSACWSPDGTEVATTNYFEKGEGTEHFIVNVKTKEKTALKLPDDYIVNDWSRDGKFLLTMSVRVLVKDGGKVQMRLYLMNRDGSEYKALADDSTNYAFGRLSPDGKRVLCRAMSGPNPPNQRAPLMLMTLLNLESGKATPVAEVPENADLQGYSWSPDGKRIAYTWRQLHDGKPDEVQNRETESFLVICDPDGKNAKTVLSEKAPRQWQITLGTVDWR